MNNKTAKPLLIYQVRVPKITGTKPPLLVLLHGVGSNENDLFSFASYLPDKFLVVSARGLIVLGPSSFAWYQVDFSTGKPVYNEQQEANSRAAILNFIDELKALHAFNENEIYLAGFSQGAIMSYSVAFIHPERIRGIAIMSGRLLEEIKPWIKKDSAKYPDVFISHGTQDNTLPIPYARDAFRYLKNLGVDIVYKEYDVGHTINDAILSDLVSWLNKKINSDRE